MRSEKKYLAERLGGKKYPAYQVARKKNLVDQKSPTPHPPTPSRVKWSARYLNTSDSQATLSEKVMGFSQPIKILTAFFITMMIIQ